MFWSASSQGLPVGKGGYPWQKDGSIYVEIPHYITVDMIDLIFFIRFRGLIIRQKVVM